MSGLRKPLSGRIRGRGGDGDLFMAVCNFYTQQGGTPLPETSSFSRVPGRRLEPGAMSANVLARSCDSLIFLISGRFRAVPRCIQDADDSAWRLRPSSTASTQALAHAPFQTMRASPVACLRSSARRW
jgi:hypothetical protein